MMVNNYLVGGAISILKNINVTGMIPYIMEKVHLILPSGYVKTGNCDLSSKNGVHQVG